MSSFYKICMNKKDVILLGLLYKCFPIVKHILKFCSVYSILKHERPFSQLNSHFFLKFLTNQSFYKHIISSRQPCLHYLMI